MTLARADAGAPTATQAPIMAAETERLIVWTIDVIDFLLLKRMLNGRANSEQMMLETAGDFGRRPCSSAPRSRLRAAKKGCGIIWSAAPADGILAARCRPNGKFGTSVDSFGQNTSLVVAEEEQKMRWDRFAIA